ncbi:MAG: hypothetical protein IPI98_00115 [Chitinophagaceae bacterium]|nr:hypothetical protein [Chitinophagaceae bacterium]
MLVAYSKSDDDFEPPIWNDCEDIAQKNSAKRFGDKFNNGKLPYPFYRPT